MNDRLFFYFFKQQQKKDIGKFYLKLLEDRRSDTQRSQEKYVFLFLNYFL